MIIIRNLTSGALWEPRFFLLHRETCVWSPARQEGLSAKANGLGATLLTVTNNRLERRLLALYLLGDDWMIFDGAREVEGTKVCATWQAQFPSSGIGLASLSLKGNDSPTTITYLRPWLRHWFEGGWALNDIDIGWLIAHYMKNDARARLRSLLSAVR